VPEKNFTVLRDRMASAATPKIPYIGTSLADLTFIEDGNPDYHDELINFTKRHLLFSTSSPSFSIINYLFFPFYFLSEYKMI
jgi:hypothetical protein